MNKTYHYPENFESFVTVKLQTGKKFKWKFHLL